VLPNEGSGGGDGDGQGEGEGADDQEVGGGPRVEECSYQCRCEGYARDEDCHAEAYTPEGSGGRVRC
jgi:hypothetical protein